MTFIDLRTEQLRRKIDDRDAEVRAWVVRCTTDEKFFANQSQILAIANLLDEFTRQQRKDIKNLGGPPGFAACAYKLSAHIADAQHVWDFFRDKLLLRRDPDLRPNVVLADTIAWDCYTPVITRAVAAGIIAPELAREPPLIGLSTGLTARTWLRGERPLERDYLLRSSVLPFPVIELPWTCLANAWELLSIPHEVAHDLEKDLKLRGDLEVALGRALQRIGAAPEVRQRWMRWLPEVFADLVAIQLSGTPYLEHLLELLVRPEHEVYGLDELDGLQPKPHPVPFVRILCGCAALRTLVDPAASAAAPQAAAALAADADAIEARWRRLYPDTPTDDPHCAAFPVVLAALMDTALPVLRDETVRALVPYSVGDDLRMRNAASELLAGRVPASDNPPRWCISAAQHAAGRITASPALSLADALSRLDTLARRYATDNTAEGVRGAPHKPAARAAFIRSRADLLRRAIT